jgi:hypothetical protein
LRRQIAEQSARWLRGYNGERPVRETPLLDDMQASIYGGA